MSKQKHSYAAAKRMADQIVERLAPHCERIEIAGSVRRKKAEVGDIEIVAVPKLHRNLFGDVDDREPSEVHQFLQSLGDSIQIEKAGQKYIQFSFGAVQAPPISTARKLVSNYTVDLFLQPDPATWGVNMMIRTGSAHFSKMMVTSRAQGGWRPPDFAFMQGRLHHGGMVLDTPEEEDVFAALRIDWVDPELRT